MTWSLALVLSVLALCTTVSFNMSGARRLKAKAADRKHEKTIAELACTAGRESGRG